VRRAADALAGAGYEAREEIPPGVDEAATLWAELLNEDVRRFWPMVEPIVSDGARRFTASALSATPVLDVEGYAMRWQARQALARRWSLYRAERPLILAPVFLEHPFAVGADIADPESAARERVMDRSRLHAGLRSTRICLAARARIFQTSVAAGGGRFVVVGHTGEALASTDGGQTWTPGTTGAEVNLDRVVFARGHFIATGEGVALSSPDGLQWSPIARPTPDRSARSP
jgi:hypothetical protein